MTFLSLVPQTEYNGHEEHFHEPITGIEDGVHKNRGIRSNPHPDSNKHRALPVDAPKAGETLTPARRILARALCRASEWDVHSFIEINQLIFHFVHLHY